MNNTRYFLRFCWGTWEVVKVEESGMEYVFTSTPNFDLAISYLQAQVGKPIIVGVGY